MYHLILFLLTQYRQNGPLDMAMMDILFVDDDLYAMATYVDVLEDDGFHIQKVSGADEALHQVTNREFAAVVLDVMMLPGQFGVRETRGGHRTGIALARHIRRAQPSLPILLLTNSDDTTIREWADRDRDGKVVYLDKPRTKPDQLVRYVRRAVGARGASPNVLVVHGRDHKAMSAVTDYLQKDLRFNELTVLCHKPNDGRTINEKFEYHADDADVVIVLLTPDDLRNTANNTSMEWTHAGLDIVFVLGYSRCAVGRRHGKVLLLNGGVQDIPLSMPGVIYIDISHGIYAAGEDIRRELAPWL